MDDQLDIGMLGEENGAHLSVSPDLDAQQPVKLSQVHDLNKLPDTMFQTFNQHQVHHSDRAIVDIHHDYSKVTISYLFVQDHLDNVAAREPKFTDKDFNELLVLASATLLQSIQGLD